jgi:3-oxoacyl-(acyl-carrier-protein) synthase
MRQFGQRFSGFLLIDRPEGLIGHSAGASSAFNMRYGACLLRFATAPRPPESC